MSDIRLLTPADIPSAMRLSQAAGWNQVPADWERLLQLEPEGCIGMQKDGEVVATATVVCYGRQLAWIGMVLTDPGHRRKGYALALMEHAMAWLEKRQVDWWKLDATHMGQPLYERLGFEVESPIERWATQVSPALEVSELPEADFDAALDREAFGADRTRVLKLLAEESATLQERGFAAGRPGSNAYSFGPCVARDIAGAGLLVRWFLGRHPGDAVYWDLLPTNRDAAELAAESGFECRRELVRMVRPGRTGATPLPADDSLVYAAAGFEYG